MDPSRIEHIWQTLWRGQFFRGGHLHAAAVAAIDIALWDLRGKALGVPCTTCWAAGPATTPGATATWPRPAVKAAADGH
jgi:L-alanine-DL-glutamate epimerase-like enolase superfamily enzyme